MVPPMRHGITTDITGGSDGAAILVVAVRSRVALSMLAIALLGAIAKRPLWWGGGKLSGLSASVGLLWGRQKRCLSGGPQRFSPCIICEET